MAGHLRGLTLFHEDRLAEWIELFAAATAEAATLATRILVLTQPRGV